MIFFDCSLSCDGSASCDHKYFDIKILNCLFKMMRLITLAITVAAVYGFVPVSQSAVKTSSSVAVADGQPRAFTALNAVLERTELPEKLYIPKEKETPKVLGGLKIGLRELVVVTGASSGLGLQAAKVLARSGKYFVVMACRDVEKAKRGKVFA